MWFGNLPAFEARRPATDLGDSLGRDVIVIRIDRVMVLTFRDLRFDHVLGLVLVTSENEGLADDRVNVADTIETGG